MRRSALAAIILLIGDPSVASPKHKDAPLSSFLAPAPGLRLTYHFLDAGVMLPGHEMLVQCIARDDVQARLRTTMRVAEGPLGGPSETREEHSLRLQEGSIEGGDSTTAPLVLLSEPLKVGTRWARVARLWRPASPIPEAPGKWTKIDPRGGGWISAENACRIDATGDVRLFGQERRLITVLCTSSQPWGTTTTTEEWASGLGVVRLRTVTRNQEGSRIGESEQRLVKVLNAGRDVAPVR